jgi:hypothetical protein
MMLLTLEDFSAKQGQEFKLILDNDRALALRLVTVQATRVHDFPGKTREPFSLFFDGTTGMLCPQGLYRLQHVSGWKVELFLVPIAGHPDGSYRYQAVFN